jgi:hypothetical protein
MLDVAGDPGECDNDRVFGIRGLSKFETAGDPLGRDEDRLVDVRRLFGFEAGEDPAERDDDRAVRVPGLFMFDAAGDPAKCPGDRDGGILRQIPGSISNLSDSDVFGGVKKIELLTLLGSTLSPRVVANLKGCLTPTAKVIGPALVGQKVGRFMFAAT